MLDQVDPHLLEMLQEHAFWPLIGALGVALPVAVLRALKQWWDARAVPRLDYDEAFERRWGFVSDLEEPPTMPALRASLQSLFWHMAIMVCVVVVGWYLALLLDWSAKVGVLLAFVLGWVVAPLLGRAFKPPSRDFDETTFAPKPLLPAHVPPEALYGAAAALVAVALIGGFAWWL